MRLKTRVAELEVMLHQLWGNTKTKIDEAKSRVNTLDKDFENRVLRMFRETKKGRDLLRDLGIKDSNEKRIELIKRRKKDASNN